MLQVLNNKIENSIKKSKHVSIFCIITNPNHKINLKNLSNFYQNTFQKNSQKNSQKFRNFLELKKIPKGGIPWKNGKKNSRNFFFDGKKIPKFRNFLKNTKKKFQNGKKNSQKKFQKIPEFLELKKIPVQPRYVLTY